VSDNTFVYYLELAKTWVTGKYGWYMGKKSVVQQFVYGAKSDHP